MSENKQLVNELKNPITTEFQRLKVYQETSYQDSIKGGDL